MFDPIKASQNIKDEFLDYVSTALKFSAPELNKLFRDELDENVTNGPYVEINNIYKTSKSLGELINDYPSLFSKRFYELDSSCKEKKIIPLDRKLYVHQEKAILKVAQGDNVIVSTGTGSGKTLCFLIPVINDLLKEIDANGGVPLSDGVRAIFIFPMNALANDQIRNVRELLRNYPNISFGVYNGATEYTDKKAEENQKELYETMYPNQQWTKLQNERISRDEMKEHPPNILFTNYAMLEHLLLRPEDDVLFTQSDMRFVILDEAHVYSGLSGIETSFLVSRLKARISKNKTQFILTSATLGSGKGDIINFGHKLTGADFFSDDVIFATLDEEVPVSTNDEISFNTIIENPEYEDIPDDDFVSREKLYNCLGLSDEFRKLRENCLGVNSIEQFSSKMEMSSETAIKFLNLCTKAQKNGKSLIDIKFHFFVRCLDGCYMSFYPRRELSLTPKKTTTIDGIDTSMFEIGICDECGTVAIVGKEKDGYLVYSKCYEEDANFYYFANKINDDIDEEDDDGNVCLFQDNAYLVCPICGKIQQTSSFNPNISICDHSPENYLHLRKADSTKGGHFKCHNCHSGRFERFFLGNNAATSVLATALYDELPINLDKYGNEIPPQFLMFTDSRQDAARFACYLSEFYNKEIVRRRSIYHVIENELEHIENEECCFGDFVNLLTNYFLNNKIYSSPTEARKNAWEALINEIARSGSPTSLSALGLLQFKYNNKEALARIDQLYLKYSSRISHDAFLEFVNVLIIDEIVKRGAIKINGDYIGDEERKYIFYNSKQQSVSLYIQKNEKNKIQWIPKNNGSADSYVHTKRMYYVKEALNITSEKEAASFLTDFFACLAGGRNDLILNAEDFTILAGNKVKLYECDNCQSVSSYTLNGHCLVSGCHGNATQINPSKVNEDNHYSKLYKEDINHPLVVKEHTAQLSRHQSLEYQQEFLQKQINALSCSTTFEMGVDIGDLEAIFLRDIPPTPSNYSQRAGRAGRSVDSAAYVLNYAKLNSHDLSYFSMPTNMISGTINAPYIKLDNDKIARRHVYAVAFSLFFRKYPSYFNFKSFIDSGEGYNEFCKWLKSNPSDLKEELLKSIPNENNLHNTLGLGNFGWVNEMIGPDGSLYSAYESYHNTINTFNELLEEIENIPRFYDDKEKQNEYNSLKRRRERFSNVDLIDFLARNNILPRHGFPIDTVELHENYYSTLPSKEFTDPNELQLSRDLKIAISEYAPSSEVVADGKVYTSRYINFPFLKPESKWHTGYIAECPNCHATNFFEVVTNNAKCISCGEKIGAQNFIESIEPRDGFIAEPSSRKPPMESLERHFSTKATFIGDISPYISPRIIPFGSKDRLLEISCESNKGLLVHSNDLFYVCDDCGFSICEDETLTGDSKSKKAFREFNNMIRSHLSSVYVKDAAHPNFKGGACNGPLKRYYLHNVFKTDVAKIDFVGMDTSDDKQMQSVMYAIYNAFADVLQIEKRELSCCLKSTIKDGIKINSIILFDSVPGGAGHTKRLVDEDERTINEIIYTALNKVMNCNCDPSCYRCLRSYENRDVHDELDRFEATKFLNEFIQ